MKTSTQLERYFKKISKECEKLYEYAKKAKTTRDDDGVVHTRLAYSLAERVVGLLVSIYPDISKTKIVSHIFSLEEKYGFLDWRVAFSIALEIAQGKHLEFKTKKDAILCGVRVGFAYITGGIVSSPLEGLVDIDIIEKRDKKGSYFRLSYGGPIRNAGATSAAVSALIADYVRKQLGYGSYDPDESEIKRFREEVYAYNTEVTNLQYLPSHEEIEYFAQHMPVEITGDPTHKQEVQKQRDLPRIKTNRIRSGMCLMMAECFCLKAPKLLKWLLKTDFKMEDWSFLNEFCVLQKQMRAKQQGVAKGDVLAPDYTFIKDLTMGRPVFSLPSAQGGFRLRYGRSRFTGLSAAGVHPATMLLCDEFLAAGTQLRVERPLKSTIVMPCDHLMGPIVRLVDGSVEYISSQKDALRVKNTVDEILFLGDILISYGDFLDRGQQLIPCGYCEEWWFEEFKTAVSNDLDDIEKLRERLNISVEYFKQLIQDPINCKITPHIAFRLSEKLNIPLHPQYTYFWSLFNVKELSLLFDFFSKGKIVSDKLIVDKKCKPLLEKIGLPHSVLDVVSISSLHTKVLLSMFGFDDVAFFSKLNMTGNTALEIINNNSCVVVRDKKGVFIGARMGRPEKAKPRHQKGGVHGFANFMKNKEAVEEFISQLPDAQTQHIKGGQGDEIWQKGALRAQYNLCVNKDGTLRYDATEAPVTHFRASEVGVSYRELKKLGYKVDIHGHELFSDEQVVEIFPQDVILPSCSESKDEPCDEYLYSVSKFVDTELKYIYNSAPVYELSSKKQLLGQLVVGLAPHTSSACILRVVGFSRTQTFLCHPYMHSAMRRDCDGDESCFLLLMDVFLNFNPSFLPNRRGSKMDAPFVITSLVEPKEVDDMVFNLDIQTSYNLDFYIATQKMKQSWDVNIRTIRNVLDTPQQFNNICFTHENGSLNDAVMVCTYKKLENMKKLVDAQLALAKKISAADENKVASLVLRKHIIKDISRSLSRYFIQEHRCSNCNKRFRRPTMSGQCKFCGGNIVPTVHIASVVKYKEIFMDIYNTYKLDDDVKKECDDLMLRLNSLNL